MPRRIRQRAAKFHTGRQRDSSDRRDRETVETGETERQHSDRRDSSDRGDMETEETVVSDMR